MAKIRNKAASTYICRDQTVTRKSRTPFTGTPYRSKIPTQIQSVIIGYVPASRLVEGVKKHDIKKSLVHVDCTPPWYEVGDDKLACPKVRNTDCSAARHRESLIDARTDATWT